MTESVSSERGEGLVLPSELCVRVKTLDDVVYLHPSFLMKSPVLRDWVARGESAPFPSECSRQALHALESAELWRIFPKEHGNLWNLLAVSTVLQLETLAEGLVCRLFANKQFVKTEYPSGCSRLVAALCVEKLFKSPCRTIDIYQNQLARWGSALDGEMVAIENAMARKLRLYQQLQLDHLPLKFKHSSVPIVIMNRTGVRQSGICFEGACEPLNIFGTYFCLQGVEIDAFYLRMEQFVFYKSRDRVYRQSLNEPDEASSVIANCTHFISRGHNIFAVTNNDSKYCVLHGDDYNGFMFDTIYCTSTEILKVDFDCDSDKLLILKPKSLSVFRREGRHLILWKQLDEHFDCALFYSGRVVAFEYAHPEKKTILPRDVSLSSMGLGVEMNLVKDLSGVLTGDEIFTLGGEIFKKSGNGLRKCVGSFEYPMMSLEEYVASSELCLLPF